MRSELKPGGAAHFILGELEGGSRTLGELREACTFARPNQNTRKLWYCVQALLDHGLALECQRRFEITRDGAETLADLREGITVICEIEEQAA